ncbi:harpin-induced like protein 10 [Zostera marina]|uniref:Harpin-induced like protein 10 n=1 Tax=Zostera marina TaxID=29655 RepID=A0A0K9PZA2_ZOSMR|nr:harpin-induced like protein 10 [Zostera marina]
MSVKHDHDCGNHRWHERHHDGIRRFFKVLLFLVILVLITVLIVWLVLRPTKPKFYLRDTTVMAFNLSITPSLLTTIIQATIAVRNPNQRIGIFYDRLQVYASYKSQPITLSSNIRPSYQPHKGVSVLSPFLYGTNVPIAPYLSTSLNQDEQSGSALLTVKIDGRIRWKVGSWTSGRYRLFVNCPAYLSFDTTFGSTDSNILSPVVRFQRISSCSVTV